MTVSNSGWTFVVGFVVCRLGVQQRQQFSGQLRPELRHELREQRFEQFRVPPRFISWVRLLLVESFANLWDKVRKHFSDV
jgi:hypothetical protein